MAPATSLGEQSMLRSSHRSCGCELRQLLQWQRTLLDGTLSPAWLPRYHLFNRQTSITIPPHKVLSSNILFQRQWNISAYRLLAEPPQRSSMGDVKAGLSTSSPLIGRAFRRTRPLGFERLHPYLFGVLMYYNSRCGARLISGITGIL